MGHDIAPLTINRLHELPIRATLRILNILIVNVFFREAY